jgi:hypothetical protein
MDRRVFKVICDISKSRQTMGYNAKQKEFNRYEPFEFEVGYKMLVDSGQWSVFVSATV